jgi:DHA2 family multidrug resistance protein
MFMAILDIQIVATALPEIQGALRITTDLMSWVQTAYLIAEVIAIPLTGFLSRLMSTRWLFVASVLLFTVASLGCASSSAFWALIVWRVLQGFASGILIPTVFSVVFILFPIRHQDRATVIAGVIAMLAPTLGPLIGGWITERYSWHWLFLINVGPGLIVALLVGLLIDIDRPRWPLFRKLDCTALAMVALSLGTLELLLKDAPARGWGSPVILGLIALSAGSGIVAVRRCRARADPLIDFDTFAQRNFTIGCWYSFALGMGLYGAVYLMPLFLAYIRQHSPLEIGLIVIVTGAAQLAAAPIAVAVETRVRPGYVTFFGYALLAAGLIAGSSLTYETDFDGLFWPQILRGFAVPFCLLPTTRLALACLEPERVSHASGLFNLMRNLGGAIGLALIDTVLELRPARHAEAIVARLQAGDRATAMLVGLPPERFKGVPIGPIDPATVEMVRPLVERAAAVASFNDAWMMLGGLIVLSLLVLPMLQPTPTHEGRRTAKGAVHG